MISGTKFHFLLLIENKPTQTSQNSESRIKYDLTICLLFIKWILKLKPDYTKTLQNFTFYQ